MGFFDILIHPRETMQAEVGKADMGAAIKTYAIYAAIIGVLIGLLVAIAATFISALAGPALNLIPGAAAIVGLGLAAIIAVPIAFIILVIVFGIISWAIMTFVAKLLGGTGTLAQNYYLSSRLVWPYLVAGIIIGVLSMIPIIGSILSLLWVLYLLRDSGYDSAFSFFLKDFVGCLVFYS
ncbi:MAG: YIP1 family protein [Candidatus Micrarchaeota archaeon]